MEQKSGSFYRIKKKEQGKEKQKISYWLGPHSQLCSELRKNKEISIEPRVGLVLGDWLTRYTVILFQWSIYIDRKVKFWFAEAVPWAGAVPSWAQKFIWTLALERKIEHRISCEDTSLPCSPSSFFPFLSFPFVSFCFLPSLFLPSYEQILSNAMCQARVSKNRCGSCS